MPNQPKTPSRAVRVPDVLWDAARDRAAQDGRTVTSVIIEALRAYVATADRKNPK
jgi:hypothetical protein